MLKDLEDNLQRLISSYCIPFLSSGSIVSFQEYHIVTCSNI